MKDFSKVLGRARLEYLEHIRDILFSNFPKHISLGQDTSFFEKVFLFHFYSPFQRGKNRRNFLFFGKTSAILEHLDIFQRTSVLTYQIE